MTDPPLNLEEEKRRAYSRVKYHFPSAKTCLCKDCGNPAREYDHPLGYGKNWDIIEPVCLSCHRRREKTRGGRQGRRKKRNLIGPKLPGGEFYFSQIKNKSMYLTYNRCK